MKLREKFRRFWTMDVHNHEGFTLVELIIVIAILAILSGVAVVGYSSYVEKANMSADKALVADIVNAVTLYYYSNIDEATSDYLALLPDDDAVPGAAGFVAAAMEAAYGKNWEQQMRLKHDGWQGYKDSPFQGNEVELMLRVEGMTEALADTITEQPGLVGANFKNYMKTELGFTDEDLANEQKVADAAVMYVANGTTRLTPEKKAEFTTVVTTSDGDFLTMMNGLIKVYNSNVMGAAATYAMIVSWCQYEDKLNNNNALMSRLGSFDATSVNANNPDELFNAIMATFDPVADYMEEQMALGENGVQFHDQEYFSKDVVSAIDGFVDVMSTVNSAKNQIELGVDNCFSTAELQKIFTMYGEGAIIILVEVQDGALKIANPLDGQ